MLLSNPNRYIDSTVFQHFDLSMSVNSPAITGPSSILLVFVDSAPSVLSGVDKCGSISSEKLGSCSNLWISSSTSSGNRYRWNTFPTPIRWSCTRAAATVNPWHFASNPVLGKTGDINCEPEEEKKSHCHHPWTCFSPNFPTRHRSLARWWISNIIPRFWIWYCEWREQIFATNCDTWVYTKMLPFARSQSIPYSQLDVEIVVFNPVVSVLFDRGERNAGNCIVSHCPGRNLRRGFFTWDRDKLYLRSAKLYEFQRSCDSLVSKCLQIWSKRIRKTAIRCRDAIGGHFKIDTRWTSPLPESEINLRRERQNRLTFIAFQ